MIGGQLCLGTASDWKGFGQQASPVSSRIGWLDITLDILNVQFQRGERGVWGATYLREGLKLRLAALLVGQGPVEHALVVLLELARSGASDGRRRLASRALARRQLLGDSVDLHKLLLGEGEALLQGGVHLGLALQVDWHVLQRAA